MSALSGDWEAALSPEFAKPYYKTLYEFVRGEYRSHEVYPPSADIFNAFHYTPLHSVKCVILGQDPYHEPMQAQGLCFSVRPGVAIPASLQNIYKELHEDIGVEIPTTGSLVPWTRQGVLLLNTILTVRAHAAMSHAGHGWETFTDAAIAALEQEDRPIVYLLWGRPAAAKAGLVTNPLHKVFMSAHPSPLSAYKGFFGSRPFSAANAFLAKQGVEPIDWRIDG